ncbi:MAG: N-acetylmuramoyl-L-alanine amidase [Caulobacteraceae bacterium]|nr:N-acetylmuramoyl-L-alanine amidase [Caulobacter sp.]
MWRVRRLRQVSQRRRTERDSAVGRLWAGWGGRAARAAAALCVLTGAAGAAAGPPSGAGAPVLKVRLGGDAHTTRVVVELAGAAKGRLLEGADPTGVVRLDLMGADAAGDMAGDGAGLVRHWSVDDDAGSARLNLQLARPAVVKRRFLLPPADGIEAYRYVVDLEGDDQPLPPAKAAEARTVRIDAPVEPVVPAKKIVVIDAGHGGKDPGAHGAEALEKRITLAAAQALKEQLQKTGRYKVVMTRDSDVFVPLTERVRIARRANADLFIALHADAGTEPELKGATVYTMSEHGADRSSESVFGGSGGDHAGANWFDVRMPGRDAAVNHILFDLTQRETRNRSGVFAEQVLDEIGEVSPLLRRSHRDAGYMVLLAPDVPAVLLEMGFITNPDDEARLTDPGERRRMMDRVASAIDDYFAQDRRIAARASHHDG